MDFKHLTLLLCICAVTSYPSKPLNDRPSDLAWQAWLLVDSQNNPSETDRRITPKSVFIAPKLGLDNGSLPDCADGYRSDPMGRCIKFVKVDEAAHLDFLLERLNAMYATKSSAESVDDDDDGVKPTSGPLQVNIPFGLGFQGVEEPETPEPEIAIIVAPTNGNFELDEAKEKKINVKRTHEEEEQRDSTMASVEETTIESTTETTTLEESTTVMPTTTETTNEEDLQALFFLLPMNKSTHVATEAPHTTTEDTEPDTSNSTPADTRAKPDLQSELSAFVEPIQVQESPTYVRSPSLRLPSDLAADLAQGSAADLAQSSAADLAQGSAADLAQASAADLAQSSEPHRLTSGEIQELFRQYIRQNPEVVALTSSEKFPVVRRRRPVSEATYDGEQAQGLARPQYHAPASFNHRNRDRNGEFWRPTPTWTEGNGQKPLVLRFGRYPATAAGVRFSPERAQDGHRYFEEQQQEFASPPFGRTRRRGNVR